MVHFYESSIITTTDGLHCQVYSNEHPEGGLIVKPKYIPMDKISSDALQCRYLSGKRMNRLNMWIEQEKLIEYIEKFKKTYPQYFWVSNLHQNLFFIVPLNKIEKIYDPRKGLSELMQIPEKFLDIHLRKVYDFVKLVEKSGLAINDLGVTYSTLVGHYFSEHSDINLVVYGKDNCMKLLQFLGNVKDPRLRWKTDEEWLHFRNLRERSSTFTKKEFLFQMTRKKTEGFFDETLFLILGVEEPNETWFKWGGEKYIPKGFAKVRAVVTNNFDSTVRPGCFEVKNSHIKGMKHLNLTKIVFYSRDYVLQAMPNEKIEASGLLEKVLPINGMPYYRLVIGYLDSYLSGRRGKEYIKVIRK